MNVMHGHRTLLTLLGAVWLALGCNPPAVPRVPKTSTPDDNTTASIRPPKSRAPRTLSDFSDAKCPAQPSSTVAVKLNSCFGLKDNDKAWSCLQRDKLWVHCGLKAEAHLEGVFFNPLCHATPSAPTSMWQAAKQLHCSLDEQFNPGDTATRVLATRNAANSFWAMLKKHRLHGPPSYSLVARGGVSLGNWQSGVLLYLSEVLKLRRDRLGVASFSTVTGASAGAVNALGSAIAGCEKPLSKPEQSLYYQTWINLGLFGRHGAAGLLPDSDAGGGQGAARLGVFNRKILREGSARGLAAIRDGKRFVAGTHSPCRVRMGLTTTYLDERTAAVHQDASARALIEVPRLRERFALDLQWRASGSGPKLHVNNLWPRRWVVGKDTVSDRQFYALLGHPKNRRDEVKINDLMEAVRASGAFPVAFPPVALRHTSVTPRGDIGKHDTSLFVDGGTLDNTPIGLAITLDEWDAKHDPNPYFEHATEGPLRAYLFVDANATSWTKPKRQKSTSDPDAVNVITRYLNFGGTLLGASLQASLLDTVERWPFIQQQGGCDSRRCLVVPTRNLPITASLLGHFMAFLERDFRIFDFYAGMADGARFAEQDANFKRELSAFAKHHPTTNKAGAEKTTQRLMLHMRSPKLRCMLDYSHARRRGTLPPKERMNAAGLPASCKSLGHAAYEALGDNRDTAVQEAIEHIADPKPNRTRAGWPNHFWEHTTSAPSSWRCTTTTRGCCPRNTTSMEKPRDSSQNYNCKATASSTYPSNSVKSKSPAMLE